MCRTCPLLHRTDICGVVQRLPRRVSVPQAQVRFLPPLLMKFTAMKILTLIIKQKWFDAILSGEKTVETREVRPTNTKYISYRDNNTGKVYKKDSDVPESAWDSEKGVDTVDVCDEETKEPIVYEHNGNEYTMTEIDYHLGKVIEKMNC